MGDKDMLLIEVSKTATRLKNKGVDLTGFYYGVKEYPVYKKVSDGLDLGQALKSEIEAEEPKEENSIEWKPEDTYVKIYPKAMSEVAKKLNGSEMLIVMKLMDYISYKSGLLKKANGYPITLKDIEKMTGLSNKTVVKSMINLVKKKVYFRGRTGIAENDPYQFYANPYIFFKGRFINQTLIDMFKDYRK